MTVFLGYLSASVAANGAMIAAGTMRMIISSPTAPTPPALYANTLTATT